LVALVGGALALVGGSITRGEVVLGPVQGRLASGQPLWAASSARSASRARVSAAWTRASSSASADIRSRWTSWTTSKATSASFRADDRARLRMRWNAWSRVTPWVAATIPEVVLDLLQQPHGRISGGHPPGRAILMDQGEAGAVGPTTVLVGPAGMAVAAGSDPAPGVARRRPSWAQLLVRGGCIT
jgi:hypothetical protein